MKRLLVICGCGHATSTVAIEKIRDYLKGENLDNQVEIIQSKIASEENRLDEYDIVVSTTVVQADLQDKVINGLPLLIGVGQDELFATIKEKVLA